MKKILAGLAAIAMLGLAACGSDEGQASTPSKKQAQPETVQTLADKLGCDYSTDQMKPMTYSAESLGCNITADLQVLLMTYDDNHKRDLGVKYVQANTQKPAICSVGEKWAACTTSGDDKTLEPLDGELV